jgi:hypothetical protein
MNKPYTGQYNGAILTVFVLWLVAAWPIINARPDWLLWYMMLPVIIPFGLLVGAWLLLQVVIVYEWIMENLRSHLTHLD